jgi:hypothetical protein
MIDEIYDPDLENKGRYEDEVREHEATKADYMVKIVEMALKQHMYLEKLARL